MKILIVEDDVLLRENFSILLKSEEFQLKFAENGAEALDTIKNESFDLVILDLCLPDIDGKDVLVEIRKVFGDTNLPVMISTAVHNENLIMELLELGANDFILKPFDQTTLKLRIRNLYKLKTTEEKFHNILSETRDVIWSLSFPDFKPLYISPSIYDLYGYTVEEFYKDPLLWQNITHPDDLHTVGEASKLLLKNGVGEREGRAIKKNGEVIWILDKSKIVYDKDQKPIRVDGSAIDITKRKLAELALAESEQRLSIAKKIANFGHWEFNIKNNKLYCSDEIYRIFDIDSQKMSFTFELFLSHIHPEDKERIYTSFIESAKTSKPLELEYRIITGKNEIKHLLAKTEVVFDANGTPLKSSGIVIDITDKKRVELNLLFSELKYRTIIDSASDAIMIAESDTGIIVEANRSAERLLNLPKEKIIGLHQTGLHPKDKIEEYINTFKDVRGETLTKIGEYIVVSSDKKYIPVEISSSIMAIKGNNYTIGIFRDITERKDSEEKILAQNRKLEELNATKDKFFSIIAHDLKTPFNAMIGFSELLLNEFDIFSDKEKLDFIESIAKTAKTSFQLLNNLLDWARSQTGAIKFKKENINLKEILNSVISLQNNAAKHKNIQINNKIVEDIYTYIDKNSIETVVRNLLSNAIKYSYNDSKIEIFTKEIKQDSVDICIEDFGMGMDKSQLGSLFSIEKSFSTKGTDGESGTGLGLILCDEFVKKNDGTITVKSSKGHGSNFCITLPLAKN